MTTTPFTEFLPIIRQQIDAQEILNQHLAKAEALAHKAVSDDFLDSPQLTVHYYLLALNDIVTKAKQLNEDLLGWLLKNIS